MQRKLIGKYLTFKFTGRKFGTTGVLLGYNDEYIVIRNFTDYLPNGYKVFKNLKVEFYSGEHEKVATKIIKLTKYSITKEPIFPIESLDNLLTFLNKKFKLIGIETQKGDAMDVVRYLGQKDNKYCFDELTTSAKWRYKLQLFEKECRFIEVDTNYLNSLRLLTKF